MTAAQVQRWNELLNGLATVLTPGPRLVVVDAHRHAAVFADRLAHALQSIGQHCLRLTNQSPLHDEDRWRAECGRYTIALADGPRWRDRPPRDGRAVEARQWDIIIWLRTPPPADLPDGRREDGAHIVVDLRDPTWPVIRHIDAALADRGTWYVSETRAFFAARAATWDARFGDDLPAYAQAVAECGLPVGGIVIDVGCGTGRALPALRAAVGPTGTVIGLDLTEQMLAAARHHGRAGHAHLVLADARYLPLPDSRIDGIFAAGLIGHLPEVEPTLIELARIAATGGRLAVFHPSGRAALAARHGRTLRPDEPLAETPLREAMFRAGWHLDRYDDPPHRFLVLATRQT